MENNKLLILNGILLFILGMRLGIQYPIIGPITGNAYYNSLDKFYGCEGVEKFYSGDGFYYDSQVLKNHIKLNCPANRSNVGDIFLANFEDISGPCDTHKKIDCEDESHLIMCLSKEYNVTCEFYTYIGYNIDGHRGIKCIEGGKWLKYN